MRQILFPLSAQPSLAWKFWVEGGMGGFKKQTVSSGPSEGTMRKWGWGEACKKLHQTGFPFDLFGRPADVGDTLSTLWGCVAHALFCVILCLEPVSCTLCSCFLRFHLCCVLFCVMFCTQCSEPAVSFTTGPLGGWGWGSDIRHCQRQIKLNGQKLPNQPYSPQSTWKILLLEKRSSSIFKESLQRFNIPIG